MAKHQRSEARSGTLPRKPITVTTVPVAWLFRELTLELLNIKPKTRPSSAFVP